jgi:hypothetical protein
MRMRCSGVTGGGAFGKSQPNEEAETAVTAQAAGIERNKKAT